MRLVIFGVVVVVVAALTAGAPLAESAFPGKGGKIAFHSDRDGNLEVYAMDRDGGNQTNLTTNPAHDLRPAWSPDGTKIAFESNRHGNWEIYVMNADGSEQTRLTNSAANDGNPAWSPDGTRIAFVSNRDGDWEVYVMHADGTGQTNLTNISSVSLQPGRLSFGYGQIIFPRPRRPCLQKQLGLTGGPQASAKSGSSISATTQTHLFGLHSQSADAG